MSSAATSEKLQFSESPPERREVTFGVRSAAGRLQVLLYAELAQSGTLLTVDADRWTVHRTHPAMSDVLIDSGTPPAGPVLAAGDWVTYSVSVSLAGGGALRLHRVYGNGTRVLWLKARYPAPTPPDTVKVRAAMSGNNCASVGADNGGWSLWTFDTLYHKGMKMQFIE